MDSLEALDVAMADQRIDMQGCLGQAQVMELGPAAAQASPLVDENEDNQEQEDEVEEAELVSPLEQYFIMGRQESTMDMLQRHLAASDNLGGGPSEIVVVPDNVSELSEKSLSQESENLGSILIPESITPAAPPVVQLL